MGSLFTLLGQWGKKIELTFEHMKEANNCVDREKTVLPEKCIAYIPDFKIYKVGVISNVPTEYTDEVLKKEIEDPLEVKGMRVERILTKKDGKVVPSNTVKVAFVTNQLPSYVKVFGLKIDVRPYVQPVLQCQRC